jgi:hypothetical protein
MNKKLMLVSIAVCISTMLMCGLFVYKSRLGNKAVSYDLRIHPMDNMPLVDDDPFAAIAQGGAPIEQRTSEYVRWLSAGLKIRVPNASGSGTIICYNTQDGYAYVQSCGHLWSGNMTAEEGKQKKITCKVITWYHNEQKLTEPREYDAEVLYYSNTRGRDCSLLRFKPDWVPQYFPIAPADFQYEPNMRLHSVGCDSGKEVAHYDVRYVGQRDTGGGWNDVVTTENSPRPGRSGGGLMTNDYYVGICWGTSSYNGDGNGFFTPLSTVRQYNKQNGYDWLNEVGVSWARMIPIIDRNNPQGTYPKDYIPLPDR